MLKKLLKHPRVIISICLILTVFFGYELTHLRLDNDIRQYFPQKDSSYKRLTESENQFGSMVVVGVALKTDEESILNAENIATIDRITKQCENLDHVSSVTSLTNIDYVYGADGGLAAGSLIDDSYTGSDADIASIKEKLINWDDMYDRVVISDNGRASQMQITLDTESTNDERTEILKEIEKITSKETKGTPLTATLYGDPVLTRDASSFMISDLIRLIPLVIIVVLITLFFSFKTLDGTLLPLISVLMSTIWSCGLMAMLDFNFTIVTSIIPVALIAVGSAYGIHVLTHYYIALDKIQGELTKEKHIDAIVTGVKEVFMAVVLAGITTIAGFISLVTSPINPLHSFAIFTSIGVALSLVLGMLFIPAMLAVKPLKSVGKRSKHIEAAAAKVKAKLERRQAEIAAKTGKNAVNANLSTTELSTNGTTDQMNSSNSGGDILYKIYKFLAGSKGRLAVFCLLIIVFSAIGLKKLVVDTSLVNYFDPNCTFRQNLNYVDDQFAGTNSFYLIVSGTEKGCMTNPEILKPLDDLQNHLTDEYSDIGKIVSFTTFIKRMNQVMHIPTPLAENSSEESGDSLSNSDDELSSFGDELASFSDDVSSFGDELSSFGDELASFSDDTTETVETDFIDPNIEYAAELSKPMTVEDGLNMLASAYAEAGGKDASVKDIVDILERKLNYNGVSYYEIPYDVKKYPVSSRTELSNLVSQYLLLFSGSLDQFADDALAPQKLRVQIQLRSHSTNLVGRIIEESKDYASKHFPEGYTIEATGPGELEYSMTSMVISSQLTSLIFSLLCVFIIIAISFKSGFAGLLGAIPLAFSIILNYMVMGFAHINLDLVTSIIASVAVGVGIDYTIHFLETYRAERALSANLEEVTKRTFEKSGHGIVTNALAVGLGFLVLYFSEFVVLRFIGILVAIVMFTSSSLALTVIPGFLNEFDPKFIRPKTDKKA